jgi:Trk K+ transport system NAD-binding subunit
MSYPLLLDEMFSGAIAEQLRAKGHDVLAVVADPDLVALPDTIANDIVTLLLM